MIMSKQSRGDKGEALVIEALKGLKQYHHLLNDITFLNKKSEMTHQIDHILIHPHGVFVIETKNYYGDIQAVPHEPFWIRTVKDKQERVHDPLKQNKSHAITIGKILKGEYPVIPVVVMVQNNAPYLGDENVINLNDLILFIESYPYIHKMQKATLDKIKKKIERRISNVTKEEHLENIGYLKQIKKEIKDEITYAIENNKCPRCNEKIYNRGYEFFCVNCGFKFKL